MGRFFRSLVFLTLALLSVGCGSAPETGPAEGKILDGTALLPGTSPQMVQVRVLQPDGLTSLCSGVAIGPSEILTAGHCFRNGVLTTVIARDDGSILPAAKINVHPEYIESDIAGAIFNDVAVVTTASPHGLPTLPLLAPLSAQPTSGEFVAVYGYGRSDVDEIGSLHMGTIKLDTVTPNHLLTVYTGDGSNPCFGDSGGPAVRFDALGVPAIVGIVSTGSATDCGAGDLTLYTNVQSDAVINFLLGLVPGLALS